MVASTIKRCMPRVLCQSGPWIARTTCVDGLATQAIARPAGLHRTRHVYWIVFAAWVCDWAPVGNESSKNIAIIAPCDAHLHETIGQVDRCPCGSVPLDSLLQSKGLPSRTSCADPVPTCNSVCGKVLPCSPFAGGTHTQSHLQFKAPLDRTPFAASCLAPAPFFLLHARCHSASLANDWDIRLILVFVYWLISRELGHRLATTCRGDGYRTTLSCIKERVIIVQNSGHMFGTLVILRRLCPQATPSTAASPCVTWARARPATRQLS